ncbi:hypothetical protein TRFO_17013 [Tritrichomonas foetus]|uniref:Uncharacterized protein n=1 Tax=Tritrichomonas foetus TaxID=1144522 RepID=A0A1J4KT43_9EUKA|nr:hypothetical protein TRFO_17013 [Tritrichomonas foetus]|eukprot:OHT12956.1 hypothetical protein TRFO_17013 [Tritrichomonas foetus]
MFEAEDLCLISTPAWNIDASTTPCTCSDFCPDGNFVAYSNQPGVLSIVSTYFGEEKNRFTQNLTTFPLTSCHFHPSEPDFVLTTSKDGFIFLYNYESGECPLLTRHLGSNLLAMCIDCLGETFAIACADGSIRLYDIENMTRTKALVKMTQRVATSQVNNIYSVVFHPEDSNIIATAGWNDRVFIWDIRSGNPERYIAGPHIRGDGVDFRNDCIVTASAREKKQIEVFDYGTGKKVREIMWDVNRANGSCTVNTLKIARNGLDLIVGGIGSPYAQIFEFTSGRIIGQTGKMGNSISSVAVSPYGSSFFYGTENGDSACQMIRVKPK